MLIAPQKPIYNAIDIVLVDYHYQINQNFKSYPDYID